MLDSIAFMAPHNLPQTTIVLPNPTLGDTALYNNEIVVKEFMSGRIGTYIKRTDRTIFDFHFELTAEKDEELRRFILAYVAETWRFYHWDSTVWTVNLVSPDYESTTVAVDEYKESSLKLEGTQI